MAGIYLHIPFCRQACHYCDFHFSTNTAVKEDLVTAMADELRLQRDYLRGENVTTIYFGGGTPSLLDPRELHLLLNTIYELFPVADRAEVTLEANPDDLSAEKLVGLKSTGINRLSIGIQTFNPEALRYLHRVHDADTAVRSVTMARKHGFDNISIDLIYAIPGQSSTQWKADIEQALALRPEHLSAYTLTIEEKTTFGNWLSKGKLLPVEETVAAQQQEMIAGMLLEAGYRHYEISNFALPGFESRHNSGYWSGDHYLGIGPSAHSYDGTSRQHNVANNHLYLRAIAGKKVPAATEALTRNEQANEYILTTLRTDTGCNLETLKQAFDYDVLSVHQRYIRELQDLRLVTLRESKLTLTESGRLLADRISADLFLSD